MDERALLEVAFCADSTWTNGFDPYQQANKNLLTSALETNKALEDFGKSKIPDVNNMPPSSDNKSVPGHGIKTVRDVIPNSRLASYGNYEYDQVVESLYVSDFTPTQYDTDFPKAASTEVWMLQEVEELFKKYTTPLSSDATAFSPSTIEPHDYSYYSTTTTQTECDINSFFKDKCAISTSNEVHLAKHIRCDAVKRIWDTPIDETPRYRRPSQPPAGPSKHTSNLDVPSTSQFIMARQYQLWGCSSECIPIPMSLSDNPYSLFEYNDIVSPSKPQYYFPSSSEVSDSAELFPYLQEGLPIPTHSPSYAIPVLQPYQQTRSHSGSPPSAKRIPVYQRPPEQHTDRRRHGADLNNLICLSKHDDRRPTAVEVELASPAVNADVDDSDPLLTSDINWLLMNYHPRVTTFQQSSHLAEELLVMERQVDEAVATASPSHERTAELSGVKLELEKDFPPINPTQKRVKSKKRMLRGGVPEAVPGTSAMSEIAVDLGVWGSRRTYKDACVNEAQLSPDSANGFPLEIDDEDDDDEPLPESIPESFWAPVIKEELRGEDRGFVDHEEYWPALVETAAKRSALKQEEAPRDEEPERWSIKDAKATKELSLEVIEEVKEVAETMVDEVKEVAVVIAAVVQEVEVTASHQSDEDLANKYQGLGEQALETVRGLRRVAVWPLDPEDADDADFATSFASSLAASLLDVPRLGRTPSTLDVDVDVDVGVDAADSSSDDGCPQMRWTAPCPEGGYVVGVTFELRPPRRAQFPLSAPDVVVPVAILPIVFTSPVSPELDVDLASEENSNAAFTPCLEPNRPESFRAQLILAEPSTPESRLAESTISTVSIPEEATASGKPCWQKQQRKKPSSRRKQAKGGARTRPEEFRGGGGSCSHMGASTMRNALVKIERQMKLARSVASELSLRYGRRVGNFCDVGVGTDDDLRPNAALLLYSGDVEITGISESGLQYSINYARALLPPECPSCLDKVSDKMDRIKDHLRAIDTHLWDEVASRLDFYLNYLARLRETVTASSWSTRVDRSTHFYEIRNRTLVVSSSSFFDGFLPALTFSYEDDCYPPLSRWPRLDEAVCLRRTVFESAGNTVIVGYLTSSCEAGVINSFAHTTTFFQGAFTFTKSSLHAAPPMSCSGLVGWSVLARLDTAVDRFLRHLAATCSTSAQQAAVSKPSVATQTDLRGAKNRIKALSKQLFQPPPAAPKTAPPAGSVGEAQGATATKHKPTVEQVPKSQAPRNQLPVNQPTGTQAPMPPPSPPPPPSEAPPCYTPAKKSKVSHIPVMTSSRRPPRPRAVQVEPEVNTDNAEVNKIKNKGHRESVESPVNLHVQDKHEQDEPVKFHDDSVRANELSSLGEKSRESLVDNRRGSCGRPARALTPIPPSILQCPWVHAGGKPPAQRSPEPAPPRKSQWIPEPLRQATARLFKRARRKQEAGEERQPGDGAEGSHNVAIPAGEDVNLKPSMVKDALKRINSTMHDCDKLKRDSADSKVKLERRCQMSSLGDDRKRLASGFRGMTPGTAVRQSGNGDAGSAATSDNKAAAAAAAADQSSLAEGPPLLGDRGDNWGRCAPPRK